MTATRFSIEYIDSLLATSDSFGKIDLYSIITGSAGFNRHLIWHGLSEALFLYVEAQAWLSAAIRSGVWTYYEVTSQKVQSNVITAMMRLAPGDVTSAYRSGHAVWRSVPEIASVDTWITDNEIRIERWLLELAKTHRKEIHALA